MTNFFGTIIQIALRPTPAHVVGGVIAALLTALANYVVNDVIKPYVEEAFGINSAALNDLKTTSPTIASLKNTYDNAPHADVYSALEKRNAVFRLAYSAMYKDGQVEGAIRKKNAVQSAVKVCRQIGYNWIVKTTTGKLCHKVEKAVGSIDDRWVQWTLNGHKEWAFDGVLPNSAQQYPGNTRHYFANGANHMNLQYDSRATQQIVAAMKSIGMADAGAAIP